jgi:trigger factor
MSLKVSTEPKENRQLEMTIEVDQERVDQELRKAARKIAGQIRIPGFRQGRAPYDIVVRNVGLGALFEEFVDELGQDLYRDAIEQENIEPYAIASLDNIDMDPLRYTLTIPLAPEVKLGEYRSLRVEETLAEVGEEEVQARIDELLEEQAGYEVVDRPSEYGDLMSIDVRAVVLDDEGNETEEIVLDETDWDITPDEENPMEPAGFDEQLVGMQPDEEKTFDIAWPEDSPSMYSGKNVRFHVTVHQIQAYQKPELTDEVAQSMGEYESAEALVESIRETLREEKSEETESAYLEEVLEKLIEISEIDYPPAAVELQIDQMIRNTDMQLRRMGLQGMEQYLKMIGQTIEEH